jgi:tetrahydromethanopterin S-methyltransferase subunit F
MAFAQAPVHIPGFRIGGEKIMAAEQAEVATSAAKRKPEYEKVTMNDGRVVEFSKNRKLLKESFIPGDGTYTDAPMVRLDFVNGETRQFFLPGGAIIYDVLNQLTAADRTSEAAAVRHFIKAACHGTEQKLGDEMSYMPKKDEPEPTLEDKIEWIDELIGRMQQLEWGVAREGGGGLAGAGILVKALCALSGKPKEEIREFLKPLSKEDRAAMKRVPEVKAKIEELEALAAKGNGIDGSALLGKLGIVSAAGG